MKILENRIGQLALAIKEQSLRPLLSNIEYEDDEIWDFEIVTLTFEEKLVGPTLVKGKNNEFVIEEEQLLEKMLVEKQHMRITIKNVLIGIDKFNLPIDCVTWSMEEDRQVLSLGRPFITTS